MLAWLDLLPANHRSDEYMQGQLHTSEVWVFYAGSRYVHGCKRLAEAFGGFDDKGSDQLLTGKTVVSLIAFAGRWDNVAPQCITRTINHIGW